jgi:GT2 family glycosyltransferase
MRRVSVVIPSHTLALLGRCVKSLLCTHDDNDKWDIVVVDDCLPERPAFDGRVRYVTGARPFCYASNVNLGIRAAPAAADVCVLNDDTFCITRNSLFELSACMDHRTGLGIVTPVFSRAERTPCQRLGHLDPMAGLWIEPTRYLTFACAYLGRDVVDQVGILDESFTGYGYDDNDYCIRARRAGFSIGVLPAVVMGHGDEWGQSSLTFRAQPDVSARFVANRERFLRKWARALVGLNDEQCQKLLDLDAAHLR